MAARKAVAEGEQMDLIEVKDALARDLEELFSTYASKIRAKNKANKEAKATRGEILNKIKKRGITPDADGVITFRMNGKRWKVEPGESKLTVSEEKDQALPEAPDKD